MKKVIVSILLAMTAVMGFAQTVGDAIYFYRNDGDFNAFFRESIDSITYSNYDVDGNYYDDIMTQVVYTADSVYRIPLAAIDSVSFVNPETIYQPNVVLMDEKLLNYLQAADGLSLIFSSTIPQELRPESGKILFSSTYEHPLLDGVFVGRVKNVIEKDNGIFVECEEVEDITDVVVQLVGIERLEDYGHQTSTRSLSDNFEIEKKKKDFGLKMKEEFGKGNEFSASGVFHLTYYGEAAYKIDLFTRIIDVKLYHDWNYDVDYDFKLEKELEWPKDDSGYIWETPPLLIAGGILELRGEVSPFFKSNAEVEINGNYLSPDLSYYTHLKYDKDKKNDNNENDPYYESQTIELPSKKGNNKGSFDGEVTLNGTIKFGEHLGFTLGTPKRIRAYAKAKMSIDMGIKVEGDINIKGSTDKNSFYNSFKDCKLGFGPVVDFKLSGEAKGFWSSEPYEKTLFEKEYPLRQYYYERYLLPEFSELKINKDIDNRSVTISTKPSRDLIVSFPVGVGIYDSKNNLIGPKYESGEYQMEGDDMTIEQTFPSLSLDESYTAMPMINFMFDIPATPTQSFKLGDNPKIISCKAGEKFTTDAYIMSEILSEATYECKEGETGWGLVMIAMINGEENLVGQSEVIPSTQKEAINPKMVFAGAIEDFIMDYNTFTATWNAGPIKVIPFIEYYKGGERKIQIVYEAAVPFEDQIIYTQEPMLLFRNAKITKIEKDDNDAVSFWETEYGLLGAAWLNRIELTKLGSDFISTSGGWALDDFMDGLNTLNGQFDVEDYPLTSILGRDLNITYYMRLNLCNGTTRPSGNCMKFQNNGMYITGVEVVDLPTNMNEDWQKARRIKDFIKSSSGLINDMMKKNGRSAH